MTEVNDRRHATALMETGDLVVNMALVISAPDLHKKLTAKEMPSLSWFKLQFCPKDATIHSALNYTGQFSVKNMIQERTTRKAHTVFTTLGQSINTTGYML